VLYFRDGDEGGELTYLADALTESLIDQLRQVRALTVVSRNGVAPFRGTDVSEDSIAKVLNVGTIVDGTVEEERNGIKVRVRLVDGGSGDAIDRASFSYPKDLLVVRDSLAADVAAFLRKRLGEEVRLRGRKSSTSVVAAWSLVQQAERARKDAEALLRADSVAAAVARLETADSLLIAAERADPRWAEAPAARSLLAFRRVRLERDDKIAAKQWVDSGMALANRALALDSTNAAALEARGSLNYARYFLQLDPDSRTQGEALDAAGADLRRAVRSDDTRAAAWRYLSYVHQQQSNSADAQLAAQRAYEADAYLDEASDVVNRLVEAHYNLGNFVDATKWCNIGASRFPNDPKFVQCRLWLLATPWTKDPNVAEAWRLYQRLATLTPKVEWDKGGSNRQQINVAAVIAYASRHDSTQRTLLADSARRVLLRARAGRELDPDLELSSDEAQVRTILGDKDEAIRLLKLYLTANPGHREGYTRSDFWMWRELRDDPRFQELVGATN
jgi:serine/threonine-protein kinase